MRLVLLVALASTACSQVERGAAEQAVLGGTATAAGAFPAVGALMYASGGEARAGCTGTLIAPDAVLTAAHCVELVDGEALPGFTLAHDTVSATPAIVAGRLAVPHEMFDLQRRIDGLGDFYDIGLLLLAEPIHDVAPLRMIRPIDAPKLRPELDLGIVGYGVSNTESYQTGIKFDATTTLVSVAATELQVSRGQGEPQNCHGDSGGPALADLGRGQRVVGAVSRSFDGTTACDHGGIDTRVDAYLDWIHARVPTGIPCGSGLAAACLHGEDEEDGGGCSTSSRGGPGSVLLALMVAALLRRRRFC